MACGVYLKKKKLWLSRKRDYEIRKLFYKYQLQKFNSVKTFINSENFSNSYHSFYVYQPERGFSVDNAKYFQSTPRHATPNMNFSLLSNDFSQTIRTQVDKINKLL